MNIQSLKLELVKQILEIESKDVLNHRIKILKKEDDDFWLQLSKEQKEEIEISRKQIEKEETEDWESLYHRLK